MTATPAGRRPVPPTPPARGPRVRRPRVAARLKVLAGAAVLAALAWGLGVDAFLDGLRAVDVAAVLVALVLGLVTALLSAARWRLVARRLGVPLRLGRAVGDTYRAQFLNSVLPAGVLGDVHRAVDHGRGDGRAARAVVLERVAGQVVVVTAGVGVLAASGASVVGPRAALVTGLVAVVVLGTGLLVSRGRWAATRWTGALRTGLDEVRSGVLARGAWPAVVALSVAGLVVHVALFVVAARTAGVLVPLVELVPLLVAALLAMVLPLSVGGWGPREATAAAGFGAAGYGAAQGLTVAVVFGVLALVSCLPGAVVLLCRPTGVRARRPGPGGAAC